MLGGQTRHLLHVDGLVVLAHGVGHRLEPLARHVDRRAVGQVAARRQIEPEERIARLQQGEEDRLIGLAARGIRLHIGEFAVEQLADALDRQFLGDVDELAAAVIALSGIALGVFVGHHRALRLENGAGDDVFRSDQLDLVALAAKLQLDGAGDLGIGLGEAGAEKGVRPGGCRLAHVLSLLVSRDTRAANRGGRPGVGFRDGCAKTPGLRSGTL
jgi:hypothetical protein